MLFFTAGSVGLATIISMNAILFYRILMRDFFCSSSSSQSSTIRSDKKTKLKCESNILNEPGFHPVTKDVNRIMKSFFDDDDEQDHKGKVEKKND